MPTPTLQELADHLAGRLQRSVTVVDPEIRILCASAHFGDEDDARVRAILQRVAVPDVYRHIQSHGVRQWTMAGHVPAARELGFKQRLVIPIRRGANLLALLMIIEEGGHELRPAELEAATQATHLMAGVLDREHHDAEQRRARRAELLIALLSDHDASREAALRQATGEPIGPLDHVVILTMMVRPARASNPDQLSLTVEAGLQNAEIREGPRLAHVFDGRVATISSAGDDPPPAAFRRRGACSTRPRGGSSPSNTRAGCSVHGPENPPPQLLDRDQADQPDRGEEGRDPRPSGAPEAVRTPVQLT